MYEMGVSRRKIAFKEGIFLGSVSGIIARYNDQQSAKSQKRVGRPPKISDRNKRAIFGAIEAGPFIKIRDFLIASGLEVSGGQLRDGFARMASYTTWHFGARS